MIPLSDDVPQKSFPIITATLIVVNSAIFLWEVMLGPAANRLILAYGAVPARIVANWTDPLVLMTLFTSMYLHGGWTHLIGNMLYLWIFGDNVEDRMGPVWFFLFYTICGVAAGLLQIAAASRVRVPSIGASGAIAGVLGAYLLLYPRSRVKTLVPLIFVFTTVQLPAIVVLGGWFLIQFFNGLASLSVVMQTGGVAWWAHVGGFVMGMVLMPVFRQKEVRPPDYWDDDEPYQPYNPW